MPQTSRRSVMAGSLILAASLVGGGTALAQSPDASAITAPPAPTDLTGSIVISGSSTVQPVSTAVQELFNAGSPGVAITVDGPGTGDGFALFCAGEIDIADASRAIRAEGEADVCAQNGVEYIELKVALDGLSVITALANDAVDCLTFADLYALTGPESIGFSDWSQAQALATELGSTTVLPAGSLTITGPGEESGTYDFFVERVIAPIAETRGQEGFTRPDYQSSPNDLTILEGVGGTADLTTTLGWVGFAFVEEDALSESPIIKPLAVDGGQGCIAPTYDTISDGTYPISRPLYIYVNTAKAAEKPELAAFVDYYLTPGVIESILTLVPYVGLSAEETQATTDAWASR